jgi:hypothetical protein
VQKTLNEALETMRFQLIVRPLLTNEGAVKISLKYPANLPGDSVVVLIDDKIVDYPENESLFAEGEHSLTILSGNYRTENRRFLVERGKILELSIMLTGLTPLLIFEAPEKAEVYLDGEALANPEIPAAVEPGTHEIRIQVSGYSLSKKIIVEKGKTYTITFMASLLVNEE